MLDYERIQCHSANEESFLEILIASERVGVWLDIVKQRQSGWEKALHKLAALVEQREAYSEEAHHAGAAAVAQNILQQCGDNTAVCSDAERVLKACHALAAGRYQVRTFTYGGNIVRIREGSLGDGLGSKVWASAHALAEVLVAQASTLLRGRRVLELGSGCGITGILAAKLGAAQVTLTDCVDPVLGNLRLSVSLNVPAPEAATKPGRNQHETAPTSNEPAAMDSKSAAAGEEGGSVAYGGSTSGPLPKRTPYPEAGGSHSAEEAAAHVEGLMLGSEAGYESDPEDWDPEDADSCDDLDFMAESQGANAGEQHGAESAGVEPVTWDYGMMRVRHMDWADSLRQLDGSQLQTSSAERESRGIAPGLDSSETFEVIIGADLLYEKEQAPALAAALKLRLAPGGRCLLLCPVRDMAVFDLFDECLAQRQLSSECEQMEATEGDLGSIGREREYEGGFRLLRLQHA